MPQIDHNIAPGPITSCQVCGSERLELVVDLGHQPLCDSLLRAEQLNEPEDYYPLRMMRCLDCSLTQTDYAVDGSVVYHPGYPYRSGITRELAEHQRSVARDIITEHKIARDALVVDIGSNDGTLLTGFKQLGMRVVGVEPTNIAEIARNENGIETVQSFFTEAVASEIRAQHGPASAMTATNVFAHMTSLGDVMRGVDTLLPPGGVFVTESHYLPEIIRLVQYDTIYHEHLRNYSLKSLICLFEQYGFTVVNVRLVNRYAGSIRVYAVKGRDHSVGRSVTEMLEKERTAGIYEKATYDAFRERTKRAKDDLLRLALKAQDNGQTFVANSCPGRGSTLVNYTGLTRDLMPYICEQPTSLKLGLHLPGKHIPIVENSRLIEEQPDYVLLLAWHYSDAISKELRARGLRSKLVMPLPEVHILDA
jgi:hypothetical protein